MVIRRRKRWGGRTFRFSLTSFRFGPNFSIRRFSITEAAFILTMAYLTSKGLGVIRQSIFNSLFGTGPDATAYFAAFRLPDTLFNLLAVGIGSVAVIIDTTFASYLSDTASIAAITNASLLYGLPAVLLAQAVGQALLPQITTRASWGRYLRMRQTILKVGGGAVLLSVPAALGLSFLGKPAIHLLFQHGAFTAHSSALTSTALLGYAVGLPALTADTLLILCFYVLKDARTPLFTNIGTLLLHVGLLALLVRVLTGTQAILAIPLTTAVTGTAEAALLCLVLFMRLRAKVKTDKGAQRLQERRLQARVQPLS